MRPEKKGICKLNFESHTAFYNVCVGCWKYDWECMCAGSSPSGWIVGGAWCGSTIFSKVASSLSIYLGPSKFFKNKSNPTYLTILLLKSCFLSFICLLAPDVFRPNSRSIDWGISFIAPRWISFFRCNDPRPTVQRVRWKFLIFFPISGVFDFVLIAKRTKVWMSPFLRTKDWSHTELECKIGKSRFR